MKWLPLSLLFVSIALFAGCDDGGGKTLPCYDECTQGALRCDGSAVQACGEGDKGCTVWTTTAECTGANEVCVVKKGGPVCAVSCPGDADCDGLRAADDCDDTNADAHSVASDGDCDGLLTAADCDDTDATAHAKAVDADCDGLLAAQDCDDTDPNSTGTGIDADCDGVTTTKDCDDTDPSAHVKADDRDCDGLVTADDCNDFDPTSHAIADDGDCDGLLTAQDCDDADSSSTARAADFDCDGVLTANDCDDANASAGAITDDGDCDGLLTADDCDDADPTAHAVADDADCDGLLTADDCDDADPSALPVAADADCDGVRTAMDCDDSDAAVGGRSADADCDGVPTAQDCEDMDANVGPSSADADCDGVPTALDCDDTTPLLGPISEDADCDGVGPLLDCNDADPNLGFDPNDVDCDGTADIVTFKKANGASPTVPANQDCITPEVCVTRASSQGLFNAYSESSYTGGTSPEGLEFAEGYVGQDATFAAWGDVIEGGSSFAFVPYAMHAIADDLWFNLLDYYWQPQAEGGGFGWARASVTTFAKAPFADFTNPANQDCVVPGVCLTRKDTQALYNAAAETGYSSQSPAGTEWAMKATQDAKPADYKTFIAATGNAPQSALGEPMSLHIVDTNLFFDVIFTEYGGSATGGGFAYSRSRALIVGCTDPAAANYDPRASVDDGWCGDWVRVTIPADADTSDPASQDCLAAGVCLARANTRGLFNAAREQRYDKSGGTSPIGTLWARMPTSSAQASSYQNWLDAMSNCPPCRVNETLSLWAVDSGRFFDVVLLRWAAGGAGGVTYLRREVEVTSTCGNNIVELGEICDDGNINNTDWCRRDCLPARCGDGILDPGEVCDLGIVNNNLPDADCRASCTLPSCGDGVKDSNEGCDDGNASTADGCDDTCTIEPGWACTPDCQTICGDGQVITGYEQCDDGNQVDGDGCEAGCTFVCAGFYSPSASFQNPTDGACLLRFDAPLQQSDAELACQVIGANLMTINDVAENAEATLVRGSGDSPWLGLSDAMVEGTFEWVSGVLVSYANWAAGEPNDAGGVEDCTALEASGLWTDQDCTQAKPYICELR